MAQSHPNGISRRRFLKTAGATALAASGPAIIIPGRAQQKTLKILDVKGFDPPSYDTWLSQYVQEWGERNDTRVILDRLIFSTLASRVRTEVAEQRGHDLVNFTANFDLFFDAEPVLDLRDVHEECERRFGKPVDIAIRQSYNANARKFHNHIPNYIIWPVVYRQDLWDAAVKFPESWEDVRLGGR
jgi:multiple sugar transport system substrate-binding protein